jgi:hypothetical protein
LLIFGIRCDGSTPTTRGGLPLFEPGDAGGVLYYTMAYIAGSSLFQRLEGERQLPLEERAADRALVAVSPLPGSD